MRIGQPASLSTTTLLAITLFFICESIETTAAAGSSTNAERCAASANRYECPACSAGDTTTTTTTTSVTFVGECLTGCPGFPSTDADGTRCIDRKIFSPAFLWRDILTIFLWLITAAIASAAGVGGGGVYVPAGILLLAFAPKQASGLSQASVFGSTLGALLLNLRNQHPQSGLIHDAPAVAMETAWNDNTTSQASTNNKNATGNPPPARAVHRADLLKADPAATTYTRPLIDYDMALYLQPMQLSGAVIGVLIQTLLPNWLYLMLAAIALCVTACLTYQKYRSTRAKERAAEDLVHKSDKETCITTDPVPVDYNRSVDEEDRSATLDRQQDPVPDSPVDDNLAQRRAYLQDDARQFPKEKILGLIVLFIGLFVITLLRGGRGVKSLVGITCNSPWYLVLFAAQFVWMLVFAVVFGVKLLRDRRAREMVNYPYLPVDVVWDMRSLRVFGSGSFFAGVLSGLIGIGSGNFLGPIMMVLGVNPVVSSATNSTMVVLTSSSVAIIFVTSGVVPWPYAVMLFATCLSSSLFGKSKIDGYVKKSGRPSFLILILSTILAIGTIGFIAITFVKLNDSNWCFAGFNEFCPVSKPGGCSAN